MFAFDVATPGNVFDMVEPVEFDEVILGCANLRRHNCQVVFQNREEVCTGICVGASSVWVGTPAGQGEPHRTEQW